MILRPFPCFICCIPVFVNLQQQGAQDVGAPEDEMALMHSHTKTHTRTRLVWVLKCRERKMQAHLRRRWSLPLRMLCTKRVSVCDM